MPSACPICRARLPSGDSCEDYFNAAQLREAADPAYYAVHHLSVPCYWLQHNRYSRQGWLAVRELLVQFIYQGLTPEMARRQNRERFDGRRRTWSITKGPRLPGVESIAWTRTIADVRLTGAGLYCADVRAWAKSILADSEKLVEASQ